MKDLDDRDGLRFRQIAIEHHVFWKSRDKDPSQSCERWRPESTDHTTFGKFQEGVRSFIYGCLPPKSQRIVRRVPVVIRLLDDSVCGSLGDNQFDHGRASFSLRIETSDLPFNSS